MHNSLNISCFFLPSAILTHSSQASVMSPPTISIITPIIEHFQSHITVTYLHLSLDSKLREYRDLVWITIVSLAHWVQSHHSIKMCQKNKLSLGQLWPLVTSDIKAPEWAMGWVKWYPAQLLICLGPALANSYTFLERPCVILYGGFQMLSNFPFVNSKPRS